MSRLLRFLSAFVVVSCLSSQAFAGGFDTPILYSARHMGMGGTAIGYVEDPSAMFHNPAGLSGVEGLELIANLSPIFGKITTSPSDDGNPSEKPDDQGLYPARETELIVAPAFLLGAGVRLADFLVVGFGLYPVASASGEYRTEGPDYAQGGENRPRINKTKLTFIEASPGLSFEPMEGLSFGVGYRVTLAELERVQGWKDEPNYFDFSASGLDAKGFRVGGMWRINEHGSLGIVYRHRIEPKLTADEGRAVGPVEDLSTTLILPSKLGLGGRTDFADFGATLDIEYGFYSQNDRTELEGCRSDQAAQPGALTCKLDGKSRKREVVDNVFDWRDAVTVRVGGEYRLWEHVSLRIGYIFDDRVSSKNYPSAFGTPPAASHSFTAGAGYRAERWQLNVATAYRMVPKISISDADTGDSAKPDPYPCATCSRAGEDYSLWLLGTYVDFSYDFDIDPLF